MVTGPCAACPGCVEREAYIRQLARALDAAIARAEQIEDLTEWAEEQTQEDS